MTLFPHKPRAVSSDQAEALAIAALGFLASEGSRIAAFLEATGLAPKDLREAARSPGFLAGVLEFLAADESLLLVFSSEKGIDPSLVLGAKQALSPDPAGSP